MLFSMGWCMIPSNGFHPGFHHLGLPMGSLDALYNVGLGPV